MCCRTAAGNKCATQSWAPCLGLRTLLHTCSQQVHGSPSLTPPRKATSVVSTLDRTNKLKQKPKENEPVSSDFLEKNPDVHKEGIQKGWFREEKDPQDMSTSLAEIGDSTFKGAVPHLGLESTLQNMKNNKKHCAEQTWRYVLKTGLQEKIWQISAKPGADEDHVDAPPSARSIWSTLMSTDPNKSPHLMSASRWILATTTVILERANSSLTNRFCASMRKTDAQMFKTSKGDEAMDRFSGFADYIYWIEEARVEDSRRKYILPSTIFYSGVCGKLLTPALVVWRI